MVYQNKIVSFKIKRLAKKNVFSRDVERTVVGRILCHCIRYEPCLKNTPLTELICNYCIALCFCWGYDNLFWLKLHSFISYITSMGRAMLNRVFGHMRTVKAQIRLRVRAVWSGPSLSADRITGYHRMHEWKTKAHMILCAWSESAHFTHTRRPKYELHHSL